MQSQPIRGLEFYLPHKAEGLPSGKTVISSSELASYITGFSIFQESGGKDWGLMSGFSVEVESGYNQKVQSEVYLPPELITVNTAWASWQSHR